MSILNSSDIPALSRLAEEGCKIVTRSECEQLGLRVLKIGMLNMMPDKAVSATERQFLRLVAGCDRRAVEFFPFSISGIPRSSTLVDYFLNHYFTFEQIKKVGLDALIITGANITKAELTQEPFWQELESTLRWADCENVSTVCSCLATHAAFKVFYDVDRRHLGAKCWGVFSHEVAESMHEHAIVSGIPKKLRMPHSRFNDVSRCDMEKNNVLIALFSDQVGVQMAVEPDLRRVYFQGHPEYDAISLLKEYKREVIRFAAGDREEYPPCPENYFISASVDIAENYKQLMLASTDRLAFLEEFPEELLAKGVTNHWQQSAMILFENWLDLLG